MRASEVKKKAAPNSFHDNVELTIVELPKFPFRIVVNNYKESEEDADDANEKVIDIEHGLPPQPKGYLKLPHYDWF